MPCGRVIRHLGTISLHLVKENTALRETGGLSRFIHHFISDVFCITRAQAAARGGNAVVAYRIRQLLITDTPSKNQGQCVLSLTGDVVDVLRSEPPTSFESFV